MPPTSLIPIVAIATIVGGWWGLGADRIAARWPAHEDGSIRPIDWRTPVVMLGPAGREPVGGDPEAEADDREDGGDGFHPIG